MARQKPKMLALGVAEAYVTGLVVRQPESMIVTSIPLSLFLLIVTPMMTPEPDLA